MSEVARSVCASCGLAFPAGWETIVSNAPGLEGRATKSRDTKSRAAVGAAKRSAAARARGRHDDPGPSAAAMIEGQRPRLEAAEGRQHLAAVGEAVARKDFDRLPQEREQIGVGAVPYLLD